MSGCEVSQLGACHRQTRVRWIDSCDVISSMGRVGISQLIGISEGIGAAMLIHTMPLLFFPFQQSAMY